MEVQLLMMSFTLIQYKYHAISIIKISYSEEPEKKEECEAIVAKIHEKFDSYGESWIQELRSRLPYKTEYNDWKSALVYVEGLINNNNQ
jgi:hypothetical protein